MAHPGWQSKTQRRVALVLVLIAAPLLYLYATSPIQPSSSTPPAVAKAIGEFEAAKAINDKARGCFLAGVVVSAMISARDTSGAREWRETERMVCDHGF